MKPLKVTTMLKLTNLLKWTLFVSLSILVGCEDEVCEDSLAANFKTLEFSYTKSTQKLLVRSTVPWTLECSESWLEFDKKEGPGDDGTVSQHINVTALHNGDAERTAMIFVKGQGFNFEVKVVQEDGRVAIGDVEYLGGVIAVGDTPDAVLSVPYSRTSGDETMTVAVVLSGAGATGLSVPALNNVDVETGSGVVYAPLAGVAAAEGPVSFRVNVTIGANTYGPFDVALPVPVSSAVRMPKPTDLIAYNVASHEVVFEWNNDRSVNRAKNWTWELRDGNTLTSNVVKKMVCNVSKGDDNNVKYIWNRFIVGGLTPGTTYYFRVKNDPTSSEAADNGKIESLWTDYLEVTTAPEPVVPANAILFQDFRYLILGGNKIFNTWGGMPDPTVNEKEITSWNVEYGRNVTAGSGAGNLFTTYPQAYRVSAGIGDWVGGNNVPGERPGNNSTYGATGMVKFGSGSALGWIKTPKLSKVVGTQDIIVRFKAAAWVETPGTISEVDKMYACVYGAGTPDDEIMVDAGGVLVSAKEFTINHGAPMTQCEMRVNGATANTQIEFAATIIRASPTLTNRWFLDDVVIVPAP